MDIRIVIGFQSLPLNLYYGKLLSVTQLSLRKFSQARYWICVMNLCTCYLSVGLDWVRSTDSYTPSDQLSLVCKAYRHSVDAQRTVSFSSSKNLRYYSSSVVSSWLYTIELLVTYLPCTGGTISRTLLPMRNLRFLYRRMAGTAVYRFQLTHNVGCNLISFIISAHKKWLICASIQVCGSTNHPDCVLCLHILHDCQ